MDKVFSLLALQVVALSRCQAMFTTDYSSACTFISENVSTCDVEVMCSSHIGGLQNAFKNHYCTRKHQITRVAPIPPPPPPWLKPSDYDSDDDENPIDTIEVYDGNEYVNKFKLNLSLKRINFEMETEIIDSIRELKEVLRGNRIEILKIVNSVGSPFKVVNLFNDLRQIELHTNINTMNLNLFLDLKSMEKIDVSQCSILFLETNSQQILHKDNNVTEINLSYNFIEKIPNNYFINFPALRNLILSHNNLKNFELLTFEGLFGLKNLQLSYNKLKVIGHTFARFVNLEELLLDNNNLSSIVETDFRSMKNLRRLNMSSNQISSIESESFETLTELNLIDLRNNKISLVLPKKLFANNTKLDTVILFNNEIRNVEPGAFHGKHINKFDIQLNCLSGTLETKTFEGLYIDSFDLSNGNITQIKDDAFNSSFFQKLDLSSNRIQSISKNAFRSLEVMVELDLSNNVLKDIEIEMTESSILSIFSAQNNSIAKISDTTFKNLSSLTLLDLSYNCISKLDPESFLYLDRLMFLSLNNNKLQKQLPSNVFRGLNKVIKINLAFARIEHLQNETFANLRNLQILNISHNELTNVDYNVFTKTGSIRILDFSYNLLKVFHVNTSTIVGVTEIRLSNNELKQISSTTFSELVFLHTLDLARNDIAQLKQNELQSLVNLTRLDLSFNTNLQVNGTVFSNLIQLEKVSLKGVKREFNFENVTNTSINVLDLSQCNISELNTIFVYNIMDLYNLILSSNKITRLDKFSFQTMSELLQLDLSNNLISYIQPGTFIHTNKLSSLNLHGNLLTHLQFGVLDGLQILHTLNISSNILREFSSSLLHNTPLIDSIALDNNAIEMFKFEEFRHTNIKVISIGGNPIPCHILTTINKPPFWFVVTAEIKDYHYENVKGITCKSDTIDNKILLRMNDTNINSSVVIAALANAIDVFRFSVEKLNQNLNSSANKAMAGEGNLETLEMLRELRKYLKQLTDKREPTSNDTNKFYSDIKDLLRNIILTNKKSTERIIYVNTNNSNVVDEHLLQKIKILNDEKDHMVEELKNIINEFKKENVDSKSQALQEFRHENSDIKGVLYFMAVCLALIIFGFVCKTAYPLLVLKTRLLRGQGLHNDVGSTQQIANVLEMQ